jgi:putative transposase
MRTPRFTDTQILAILKQNQAGISPQQLCREHGMSSASFYKWRAKYGGMDASLIKEMKELRAENARLKKMYADERLKAQIRQEALEGKL